MRTDCVLSGAFLSFSVFGFNSYVRAGCVDNRRNLNIRVIVSILMCAQVASQAFRENAPVFIVSILMCAQIASCPPPRTACKSPVSILMCAQVASRQSGLMRGKWDVSILMCAQVASAKIDKNPC